MKIWKSPLLSLAALALLVTVGCADPAANAPKAEVSEPVADTPADQGYDDAGMTAGADEMIEGVEYALSDETSVEFVGSKVTGSHDGGFKEVWGEVTVADGDPTKAHVSVTMDTTSLYSDTEKLTGHLKSPDFFDVEAHPTASFESTSIEKTDDGYRITGNLDLHGVTKQISFPATVTVAADRVTANAEFSIKRFDFNIEYKGKADDLIRDDVLIKLNVVATRDAAGPVA